MASAKFIQMFAICRSNLYPVYYRIRLIRDEKLQMPDDFGNELCKWSFECKCAWRVTQHDILMATEIIHHGRKDNDGGGCTAEAGTPGLPSGSQNLDIP
jgi:hypothetical protein